LSKSEPFPLTSFSDHTEAVLAILYDRQLKLLISTDNNTIIARLLPFE